MHVLLKLAFMGSLGFSPQEYNIFG
jgi:hypothetical protein